MIQESIDLKTNWRAQQILSLRSNDKIVINSHFRTLEIDQKVYITLRNINSNLGKNNISCHFTQWLLPFSPLSSVVQSCLDGEVGEDQELCP